MLSKELIFTGTYFYSIFAKSSSKSARKLYKQRKCSDLQTRTLNLIYVESANAWKRLRRCEKFKKHHSLKGAGVSYKQNFVFVDTEIKQNFPGTENFRIWFLLFLTAIAKTFSLEGTLGLRLSLHLAFRFSCHFVLSPHPESLVVWQFMRQLVHKICFTRYQVLLYLRWIKPVQECC